MSAREEALVERAVLRTIGQDPGLALYRNEVGQGFTGNVFHLVDEATRSILQRHRITYGLGVGSPDLAGSLDGRAFYLELKAPGGGRVEPAQERWHQAARAKRAFVAVVRSAQEAQEALIRCRRGDFE